MRSRSQLFSYKKNVTKTRKDILHEVVTQSIVSCKSSIVWKPEKRKSFFFSSNFLCLYKKTKIVVKIIEEQIKYMREHMLNNRAYKNFSTQKKSFFCYY